MSMQSLEKDHSSPTPTTTATVDPPTSADPIGANVVAPVVTPSTLAVDNSSSSAEVVGPLQRSLTAIRGQATFEVVEVKYEPQDLQVTMRVISSPGHMDADRADLAEIQTESKEGRCSLQRQRITKDQNQVELTLKIPYYKLSVGKLPPSTTREQLAKVLPATTLRVVWVDPSNNKILHWMGGIDNKGAILDSLVRFRPPKLDEIKKVEKVPKKDLNALQPMTPGHELMKAYPNVLQPDPGRGAVDPAQRRGVATNLEVESEYTLLGDDGRTALDKTLGLLLSVVATNPAEFGLKAVEDLSSKVGEYTDTYYDVLSRGNANPTANLAFIRNQVVFRTRSKVNDPSDLNLMSVKGATSGFQGSDKTRQPERIRVAAQAHLKPDALKHHENSPESKELRSFISQPNLPSGHTNPFGSVVTDKVGNALGELDSWLLKPLLTIKSSRRKIVMVLPSGQTVEFSADAATATIVPEALAALTELGVKVQLESAEIFTFEFGLGHPGPTGMAGVNSAHTPTPDASSGPSKVEQTRAMFGKTQAQELQELAASLPRDYHVPNDRNNPALLETDDHLKFQQLRNRLTDLLSTSGLEFELGGNKVYTLARMMGIVQ